MQAVNGIVGAAARKALALAVLLMLLAPAGPALAEAFEVRTASLGLRDGFWMLSARIDYRLSEEAITALENGVTLTLRVEVEIERVRRWLPDAELLAAERDWQLSYEPLSKRYLVRYPDDREPTAHATLFGALNAIGRVQNLPVAGEGTLRGAEGYGVAVRASLSDKSLPAPLRFLAFWNGGLSAESEWYEWTFSP